MTHKQLKKRREASKPVPDAFGRSERAADASGKPDAGERTGDLPSLDIAASASGGGESAEHDRMLERLEEHSPEGRGPSRSTERLERRLLVPLILVGLLAVLAVIYRLAGIPGVAVGVVLLTVYYFMGWFPEVIAAVLRRKEHKDFETQIAESLKKRREASAPLPRAALRRPPDDLVEEAELESFPASDAPADRQRSDSAGASARSVVTETPKASKGEGS